MSKVGPILVVENDSNTRELLGGALEDEGYAVIAAMDGIDALDRLRSGGVVPSLILLDWTMPRMDGTQLLHELAVDPRWSHIPTLVVGADARAREKAELLGAVGFVEKPIHAGALFATVAHALGSTIASGQGRAEPSKSTDSGAGDGYGPALGAEVHGGGTRFALWTNRASECAVRVATDAAQSARTAALHPQGEGVFAAELAGVGHGARYAFVLDGVEVGDPYARFLPDGVGAPAMVWRSSYAWKHAPVFRPLREHVLYELHVGTFTGEGTYAGAAARLPDLAELGITAVELMPIGAFPGSRGWGYDGVAHYAPFAPYGDPDQLRAFIDRAHGLGLAVFLDVVYNHFGPAGNVLRVYSLDYFAAGGATPWGDALNVAHPAMRRYIVRNVRCWLDEFRFDGLRLDAVHAIADDSSPHILTEIAGEATKLSPRRLLIAEDDRNDPRFIRTHELDAAWADDFHHQLHVALTGERDGYYAAYGGSAADLAQTIERGWFYTGAPYPPTGRPRGREAPDLPAEAFVYCIQNHDQVGNRAFGDRLSEGVSAQDFAAATMLLLFLPMTPLLFMGQEWGASAPFLYFTDHEGDLAHRIAEGRRVEFARFAAFAAESARSSIPDPQDAATFARSRLDWAERDRGRHAEIFAVCRRMLELRASDPVLRRAGRDHLRAFADDGMLVVQRWIGDDARALFLNLGGRPAAPRLDGAVGRPSPRLASGRRAEWGAAMEPHAALLVSYERSSR